MKRLILILVLGQVLALSARAQLQVVPALNLPQFLQQVPNILFDSTVTVTNVTFAGDSTQIGTFNGTATVLGVDTGVILCTGSVFGAVGPNSSGSSSLGGGAFGASDPDLAALSMPYPVNDAAVLEFDATSTTDTLRFAFVFASDEYVEYVNSVNDVMGIFVSGPGISGPYVNGAANIALVPGATDEVSVNTVNNVVNPAFYVDNGTGNTYPYNTFGIYPQYDGFTTPIAASVPVVPGAAYHVKVAIGDASDTVWDSGIFLASRALVAGVDSTVIDSVLSMAVRPVPNPDMDLFWANGQLHLRGMDLTGGPALVRVIDLQGRRVAEHQLGTGGSMSMPLLLPAACYVITVSQAQRSTSKRIVVAE